MKSIGRLLRGELYKMWKSKILFIMTAILCAAIIIMGAIYSQYDKQVSGLISMMLGGDTRITAFDLLDGKAEDLLKEAGLSPESLTEFQEAFNQIQSQPEVKAMLVTVSPAVLQEMAKLTTPVNPENPMSAPFFSWISGHAPDASEEDIRNLAMKFMSYGSFAEMQEMVATDYLENYIREDGMMNARIGALCEALRNDGAYGVAVVSFIEEQLDAFYRDYRSMTQAYRTYTAVQSSSASEEQKYAGFTALMGAFLNVLTDYSSIEFFTKANMMTTNFLLIPTEGMMSLSYEEYSQSLAPFKSTMFADATNSYLKILSDKADTDSVNRFKEEFLTLMNPSYIAASTEPVPYDRAGKSAETFVSGVAGLISSIESSSSSIFAYESATVRDVVRKAESGQTLTAAEQKIYDKYQTESGETDPLLPAKTLIRTSYTGEITEEVYNSQIRPYYDDKELPLIEAAEQKLGNVRARYTDAELIYNMIEGLGSGISKAEYLTLYEDYRSAYGEYASRTSTMRNLIVNVNLLETIEANHLKDADAKKILGFMMSSRYTLRSEVSKAQYLISSDKLAKDFVAPESLGNGWGAMQFIFVLTSIVILVFGIVLAAGAIAGEHSGGTMKLLLIRPHRRWQVLIAKFLSVAIVVFGMYLLNYLMTLGVGGIFWGLESLPALSIVNSVNATVFHPAVVMLLMHAFGFLEAVIFAQISLTLSTVIKSRSGAVSVSMLVYFLSFVLSALLSGFGWYKFILFNNTNLTQYFTSTGPSLADMTLGFSLIVDLVYIVVLAVVGLFTFAKRDAT